MNKKRCSKCRVEKDREEFNKRKSAPDGLYYQCKDCERESQRNLYPRYKDRMIEYAKKYSHDNKERLKEKRKENYENNKDAHRARARKYQYGISKEEYDRLFEKQNGVCFICGKENRRVLCVDHDHNTGEVRGLLCDKCNTAIGFMNEDIGAIQKMINYITRRDK